MSFDLTTQCNLLRACRTTSEIKAFRAKLTHEQAQAVIKALEPIERAAILLALHFGGTMGHGSWAGPADARIVPPTLEADSIDGCDRNPSNEDAGGDDQHP